MKKLISFASAICLLTASLPFTAAAQEYEPIPVYDGSVDWKTHYSAVAAGIKEGKYFADFNEDGRTDLIDADLIMAYVACKMTGSTLSLSGDKFTTQSPRNALTYYKMNYEVEEDYPLFFFVYSDICGNEVENIEKYGDLNADGIIDTIDASELQRIFYYGRQLGDIDMDDKIDASDASMVLEYYSQTMTGDTNGSGGIFAINHLGDINEDGVVDANDACKILEIYSESMTSRY